MARGNTVKLIFGGDATSLSRTFDKVGRDSAEMAEDIRRSSRLSAEHLERLDDGASNTERGFRGLNDGIGGTTALLGTFGVAAGGTVGTVGDMVQGFTDLAGFVGDFAAQIPPLLAKMGILTVATETETGAQYALNTAFLANPIFLVVAAIVALTAAFVVAWQHSETFRNIVTGTFDAIAGAAVSAYNWFRDNWPLLLAILTGPFGLAVYAIVRFRDDITGAFVNGYNWFVETWSKLWDVIVYPFRVAKSFIGSIKGDIIDIWENLAGTLASIFKAPINAVIGAWNGIHFSMPSVNTHIPGVGTIGGFTISTPNIPYLAAGGIVTRPTLAVVGEAGPEAVVPLNRMSSVGGGGGGGNAYVTIQTLDPAVAGRVVQAALLDLGFRNGGRVGLR